MDAVTLIGRFVVSGWARRPSGQRVEITRAITARLIDGRPVLTTRDGGGSHERPLSPLIAEGIAAWLLLPPDDAES